MASRMRRRSMGGRPRLAGLGSIGLRQAHWASVRLFSYMAFFTPQRKLRLKSAAKLQVGCQLILPLFIRSPSNSSVNRNPNPKKLIIQTDSKSINRAFHSRPEFVKSLTCIKNFNGLTCDTDGMEMTAEQTDVNIVSASASKTVSFSSKRLNREWKTMEAMIQIHCRAHHSSHGIDWK